MMIPDSGLLYLGHPVITTSGSTLSSTEYPRW